MTDTQNINSAITTLEEHIKRKWADISASTAGEQYTYVSEKLESVEDIMAELRQLNDEFKSIEL